MGKVVSIKPGNTSKQKTIEKITREWVPHQQGKHLCGCGCGIIIVVKWHHFYDGIPRFAVGHRTPGLGRGPAEPRFWKRVKKTEGCWLWTGAKYPRGYGKLFPTQNNAVAAHRFSYELHFGTIPEGLCVCHRCDNPSCVRPDHLFLGSPADNAHDRDKKGRTANGRNKPNAKLTVDDVVAIRKKYWGIEGECVWPGELARQYGISRTSLRMTAQGQNWKHVPMPDGLGTRPRFKGGTKKGSTKRRR